MNARNDPFPVGYLSYGQISHNPVVQYVCRTCGEAGDGARNQQFCAKCKGEHKKAYQRRYMRLYSRRKRAEAAS